MRGSRYLRTFMLSMLSTYVILLTLPAGLLLLYLRYAYEGGSKFGLAWLIAVAAALAALFIWLFWLTARRFRHRFRRMIEGINAMLEGDRSAQQARMPVDAGDELGRLGLAFNDLQEYMADRYEAAVRELSLSDRLQRRLLERGQRELAGFAVAAECRQTQAVGGDLYDIVPLGEDRFALLIGDVSGKGMTAALLMSGVMALFRREVREGGSAAEVLTRLNRQLYGALQGSGFVSAALAICDRDSAEIEYASAGHMPPYVLEASGELRELEVSSLPLGVVEELTCCRRRIALPAGSRLVLYTDGLVESADAGGELLGFDGLEACLKRMEPAAQPARQLDELLAQVDAYGRGSESDDRTAIVLARL